MTAKYTSWFVDETSGDIADPTNSSIIASINYHLKDAEVNARLIAAAPDLLELLVENLTHLDETLHRLSLVGLGTDNTALQDLADRTRMAIEKGRGC